MALRVLENCEFCFQIRSWQNDTLPALSMDDKVYRGIIVMNSSMSPLWPCQQLPYIAHRLACRMVPEVILHEEYAVRDAEPLKYMKV